jgi:drug/metabolite transporter (DMT)-like permease
MKTNLYVYAVPVVTMLASALFLREKITAVGLTGVALVVGGMMLSSLDGAGKQRINGRKK